MISRGTPGPLILAGGSFALRAYWLLSERYSTAMCQWYSLFCGQLPKLTLLNLGIFNIWEEFLISIENLKFLSFNWQNSPPPSLRIFNRGGGFFMNPLTPSIKLLHSVHWSTVCWSGFICRDMYILVRNTEYNLGKGSYLYILPNLRNTVFRKEEWVDYLCTYWRHQ